MSKTAYRLELNISNYNTNQTLPDLQFVSSGFEGLNILNVHLWFSNYNSTHPTHSSQLIRYTTNDLVFDRGSFYKCVTTHSGTTRPANSVNWAQVFWDVNGYNSLHGSYNGIAYSSKPPDDLRLQANSFYNVKGIGLYDNQNNTSNTYIECEYTYDTGTTYVYSLPVLKTKELNKAEVLRKLGNCYIRRKVTPVNSYGSGSVSTSEWLSL